MCVLQLVRRLLPLFGSKRSWSWQQLWVKAKRGSSSTLCLCAGRLTTEGGLEVR